MSKDTHTPAKASGSKKARLAIGIDIGGTGMKGGIVDLKHGKLVGERVRIPTPQPATPEAVAQVLKQIVDALDARGEEKLDPSTPIGVDFPAIIKDGVALSAANVDESWIGTDVDALFTKTLGREVHVFNDADAAGVAEVHYGAGRDASGTVLVITLGTGIGSALIHNGVLIPNAELGHLEIDGHDAETRASAVARERDGISFEEYATTRLQRYFEHLEFLFSPSLFIVGGGISKRSDEFLPLLKLRTPIVPAKLLNQAGIVGSARQAARPAESPAKK